MTEEQQNTTSLDPNTGLGDLPKQHPQLQAPIDSLGGHGASTFQHEGNQPEMSKPVNTEHKGPTILGSEEARQVSEKLQSTRELAQQQAAGG